MRSEACQQRSTTRLARATSAVSVLTFTCSALFLYAALLSSSALLSCSRLISSASLSETIEMLCASVTRCVGVNSDFEQQCRDELDDAHEDRRLDHRDLAACADCTRKNSDPTSGQASCDRLLERRDCDVACENVSLVLRARTTRAQRTQLCDAFEVACGPHFATDECPTNLNTALADALESGSDLDLHVQACFACVTPHRESSVDPAFACQTLIDGCSEICQPVQAVNARFVRARAELAWCADPAPCEVPGPLTDAGVRDAGPGNASMLSDDAREPGPSSDTFEANPRDSNSDAGSSDKADPARSSSDAGSSDAGSSDAGKELECALVSGPISEQCCLHGDALPSASGCRPPDVGVDGTAEAVPEGSATGTAAASTSTATTD